MKNYYEIIGVRRDANAFEIRDKAQELAQEINEAYAVLSNSEKRTDYDAQLDTFFKRKASRSRLKHRLSDYLQILLPFIVCIIIAAIIHSLLNHLDIQVLHQLVPANMYRYLQYIPTVLTIFGIFLSCLSMWRYYSMFR